MAVFGQACRLGHAAGAAPRVLQLWRRPVGLRPLLARSYCKSPSFDKIGESSGAAAALEKGSSTFNEDLWAGTQKPFNTLDLFPRRHIGIQQDQQQPMLKALDPPVDSMDAFISQVIPPGVLQPPTSFNLYSAYRDSGGALVSQVTESEMLDTGRSLAELNQHGGTATKSAGGTVTNFLGGGYYGTLVPEVIKRNVLENPAWYTSYTPYQAEISQGRLESLLNFQTLVTDLTGLPISNASLLDEGTAAAEAMTLSLNSLSSSRAKRAGKTYVVSDQMFPQTIQVMQGRAEGFGIHLKVMDLSSPNADISAIEALGEDLIGVMVQYPDTRGQVHDFRKLADLVHRQGALLSAGTDLLALTYLTPPGEWGADVAFGSAQRLGVPMGYGGPHAGFFAVGDKHKRKMPGRLIGVSKDRLGKRALRLALQTREQHIRREKATSNVCTAQALLANMSAFYAVYHGPKGLRAIAERCNAAARGIQKIAEGLGYKTLHSEAPGGAVAFDTVVLVVPGIAESLVAAAEEHMLHLRQIDHDQVGVTVDESTTWTHLRSLCQFLLEHAQTAARDGMKTGRDWRKVLWASAPGGLPDFFQRQSSFLEHAVFNSHHSETEMLRYMQHLESKDLSLVHSMIPLGSCTMKLNASTQMALITLPGFADLHPQVPSKFASGYRLMKKDLEQQLASITGLDACSLQPNSGAQGEFAGLGVIRDFLQAKGEGKRDICLIPVSAHGTNPASAAMAGMRVVPIKCDVKTGNLDVDDLRTKCEKHKDQLAAIMVTYPSTFGVFEPCIREVCDIVHEHGGQVYMDGANMNAQIGLTSPGHIGADVCHLNLHKTFCIPHGGGGPGVGPICVRQHLAPYLPEANGKRVSSAESGSASILPISWSYICMMGKKGLIRATEIAILNANYLLARLKPHYPILYTNEHGRCAHEFILDARPFSVSAGIEAIDIAKRLQDYGFHAPTMSWPVANTLMIEPTESESREELDRFADALIAIRDEIREVESGKQPREGNVLKRAPHPLADIIGGDGDAGAKWERPYSREKAAYPLPWLREKKFWPSVARVDDAYGDLNLFCTCPPVEDTTEGNLP